MKKNKKILLLGILIIAGTTFAWEMGGGVKWIGESTESQKDNRFEDYSNNTSNYGTGYYLDTYIGKKWQAYGGKTGLAWAKDCSTDSNDNNYCGDYTDPEWTGNHYDYSGHYPSGGNENDFEVHKYCEGLGAGWRVPTKRELMSIMTDTKPSGMNYYTALSSISTSSYWSSTTYVSDLRAAWYGYSSIGSIGYNYKNYVGSSRHTICIHD